MTVRARLRTTLAPCPLHDLDVRVSQVSGERGWDLYVLDASAPELVSEALERLSSLMEGDMAVLSRQGTSAVLRGRHIAEPLFEAIREAGCMVLWPAHYEEGIGHLDVVAPDRAALQTLAGQLGPTEVDMVTEVDPAEYGPSVPLAGLTNHLTRRQYEILTTAVEEGLYDLPRRTTVKQLAERFDVAASTVAEHLRKAEAVAVREFSDLVSRHPSLMSSGFKGPGRPPEDRLTPQE